MLNEINDNNTVEEVKTPINNGDDASATKAPADTDKQIKDKCLKNFARKHGVTTNENHRFLNVVLKQLFNNFEKQHGAEPIL